MKEFFQNIIDKAIYLYNEHLSLILLIILVLILILILLIILSKYISKKKEIKVINENIKNQSLYTQEEINNIANNVADKSKFISSISPESIVEDKTKNKKTKKQADTKTTTKNTAKTTTKNDVKVKKDTTSTTQKSSKKTTTKNDVKVEKDTTSTTQKNTAKKSAKKTETKKQEANALPTETAITSTTTTNKEDANQDKKQPVKKSYSGKWKIKQVETKYYAELIASNGGILLKTEFYASLSGVKNGIETIKKNIDEGNFTISLDKHGHYRFKLFSKLNRLICISEDYSSRAKCDSGIESVKRFAKTAYVLIEE